MFNFKRVMSDYLVDLADLDTYGCDPMTIEGLRDEFEVFAHPLEDDDGWSRI